MGTRGAEAIEKRPEEREERGAKRKPVDWGWRNKRRDRESVRIDLARRFLLSLTLSLSLSGSVRLVSAIPLLSSVFSSNRPRRQILEMGPKRTVV